MPARPTRHRLAAHPLQLEIPRARVEVEARPDAQLLYFRHRAQQLRLHCRGISVHWTRHLQSVSPATAELGASDCAATLKARSAFRNPAMTRSPAAGRKRRSASRMSASPIAAQHSL